MKQTIRVAAGQGFWGDLPEAPVRQVEEGPIDYLMLDYLAEVTMSIMQKQRSRDPRAGFARDFVAQVAEALPILVQRGARAVTNAGGVNPLACRGALLETAQSRGYPVEVAAALGDLPLSQRESIVAHLWGGLTFEQIADVTGTSASTAHRQYQAGILELRERLGAACPSMNRMPTRM
jgi:DNA-directed RNA polymerase specialized sigma24 family protein